MNPDAEAALDAISHALGQVVGESAGGPADTSRETLLALALATGRRRMTERKMTLYAKMAQSSAPHEVAALLDGVASEENEGTRLGGLSEILPYLPEDLLARAASIAHGFSDPSMQVIALARVAARLADDQQRRCFEEVFSLARSALAVRRWDSVHLLETLASTVPDAYVRPVLSLAGQADLEADSIRHVMAAAYRRMAENNPDRASADAEGLTSADRDSVLAAAAVSTARLGDWHRAIKITSRIAGQGEALAEALTAILPVLPAADDPGFLRELARLDNWRLIPFLRQTIQTVPVTEQGARALWAMAQSKPDELERFKASAVIAPLLSSDEASEMLAEILNGVPRASQSALADLVPGLDLAQTRLAFDWLSSAGSLDSSEIAAALGLRLAALSQPEEAISRLTDARLSGRRSALEALVAQVPDRLLTAIRAACQPRPVTEDRIAARQALVPHLAPDRAKVVVNEIVTDAALLPTLCARMRVLARLVGDGIDSAKGPLTEAIRSACTTPYGVNSDRDVVVALRTAGPAAAWTAQPLTHHRHHGLSPRGHEHACKYPGRRSERPGRTANDNRQTIRRLPISL
jgi:hypothetical protein